MLQLNERTKQDGGFFITGSYSLVIVPIINDVLMLESPDREFVFTPNPTDVDDDTQIPNIIHADQDSGFFVNVNEAGTKTITIRGTTGQFPKKDKTFGVLGPMGMQISAIADVFRGNSRPDGYTVWMDLRNFFSRWFTLVRDEPSDWAMLLVNAKDAEFFQVLPMSIRKPRTSSRPLGYAYAITFQVISEFRPTGRYELRKSWLDHINEIRSKITQWKQAINNSIVLSSYMVRSAGTQYLGANPIQVSMREVSSLINSMSDGLQGMAYTGDVLTSTAASTQEQVVEAVRNLNRTVQDVSKEAEVSKTGRITGTTVLRSSLPNVVPPSRSNVASLFAPVEDVVLSTTQYVAQGYPGGIKSGLVPDDPFIDTYGASLGLWMQGQLAADLAPLADDSFVGRSGSETRTMHEAARIGAAGYLDGRSNELASASLAVETRDISGTRHPVAAADSSLKSHSLHYLTASVLESWASGNNNKVSPELDTFRRDLIGMRDPSSLSPRYKVVTVGATDSIYSLAEQYLGSWNRWAEIAFINDLRHPYVSPGGGEGCASPGDIIYVPKGDSNVSIDLIENISNIVRTHDRVSTQDAYIGFDLEINNKGDTVFNGYDISHIAGVGAFEQEMAIVLEGSGGIVWDRTAGPGIKIGTKSRGMSSLAMWRGLLNQWLSSDPRIVRIDALKVWQDVDAVYFYMSIVFDGYDTAVSTRGELRS